MINLVFSSVMFIMFNVFIFSAYFYMNNKYKDMQSSLLKDLKKAIKILLVLDTIILMVCFNPLIQVNDFFQSIL